MSQIIFQMFQDLRRHATYKDIVWHILRHDRTCRDHHILADGYTRYDRYIPANPYIVTNPHGGRCSQVFSPASR